MYFDFLTLAVAAMVLVTLTLQVTATRRVRCDAGSDAQQKKMQLWLVWALPVIGAAVVLSVLQDEPVSKLQAPSSQTKT